MFGIAIVYVQNVNENFNTTLFYIRKNCKKKKKQVNI